MARANESEGGVPSFRRSKTGYTTVTSVTPRSNPGHTEQILKRGQIASNSLGC